MGDRPLDDLRSLPDRYRDALASQAGEPAEPGDPGERREVAPEAVEEAARARDVLDNAARRVERLIEDAQPIAAEVEPLPPKRGHYSLDPDTVLEVLETNAERLAGLVEAAPGTAGDRPAVRDGLEAIATGLASEAVGESERHLLATERPPG